MFCMRNKKHIFLYALLTKGLKNADQTVWMPRQVCTFVFRINKIRPRGYKNLFSYSTQLSTKLILLINVKMPTIVGILTFISMINITSERLTARNFFISGYCSFYKQLKLRAQLS